MPRPFRVGDRVEYYLDTWVKGLPGNKGTVIWVDTLYAYINWDKPCDPPGNRYKGHDNVWPCQLKRPGFRHIDPETPFLKSLHEYIASELQ